MKLSKTNIRLWLLAASLALAVVMNFWLFSYDRHHSNELNDLIGNHIMNITLWFVIFTVIGFGLFYVTKFVRSLIVK